jgi:hypothetical protein
MSLDALQQVLDRSYREAGSLTRTFLAEEPWRADEVADFVNQARDLTLATVMPDGTPHAAVVIGGCLDGDLYCTASIGSAMLRNIRLAPAVAFTMTDRAHQLMGRGVAHVMGRSLDLPELLDQLAAASAIEKFAPPFWDGYLCRLDPDRLFPT